jgi:sugar phosphate isomerase/epimerase
MPHTFSRRHLLTASAAALAGRPVLAQSNGKNVPFKLGVASYSLRKLSRADAIKALETLNVKYVNIKEFHAPIKETPEQWKQARRDFESAGITILGVGNISMTKNDEGEIRRNFDYAKALGAPLIVMAPSHETVPVIEKFVKEYNIKAAIHNHGPEDKHFPAPKDVLDAVKGMDKRMGLCIDVGHTTRTGADVVEWIRIAGKEGRLHDLHIKDLADLMVSKSQVAVGEGKMPVREIFAELTRQKFRGGVMLEYEINADNPVPGMQKSFEHMRRVLAELKS